MKGFIKISAMFSASFFIFSLCAKAAAVPPLPAPTPALPQTPAVLNETIRNQATTYVEAPNTEEAVIGHTEFDEFNNVNDPLYREGSKVLLEKAAEEDASPKAAAAKLPVKKNDMRDAPADRPVKTVQPAPALNVPVREVKEIKAPVFPVKKNKLIKLIPADPVETKSTL